MKKSFILFVMLFVLCFGVHAQSVVLDKVRTYSSENGFFDLIVEPIDNEITNIESARFRINLTNNKQSLDYIGVTFVDPQDWKLINTDPIYYGTSETTLYPLKSMTYDIVLEPKVDIIPGGQVIKAIFKARKSGEIVEVPLDVYVKTSAFAKYSPDIKVEVIMDEKVDPREDTEITINLENYNARVYGEEEIRVVMTSKLLEDHEVLIGLGARVGEAPAVANVKFKLPKNPNQGPMDDKIEGYIEIGDLKINIPKFDFEIIDYTEKFTEEIDIASSYLGFKTIKTLVYTNDGNNLKEQIVQVPTGCLSRFFTNTNPDARITKETTGQRYFEWDLELEPKTSKTIYVTQSYVWLILLILLAIGMIFYSYMSKSPVIVEKEAFNIETCDGGISEMKVNVIVKNTSTKPIEKLQIIDKVPNIVDVMQEFDVGTLKPNKILKREGSSLIKWEIPELDPYEERILTYKIKSKLSILGDFTLPVANVKYHKGKRKIVIYSNNVSVQA